MDGKVVVLTGTFSAMKRAEAAKALKELGAQIGSGVSKKTDILFAGSKAGSKLAKAEALGVTVMSEADLMAILAGEKAGDTAPRDTATGDKTSVSTAPVAAPEPTPPAVINSPGDAFRLVPVPAGQEPKVPRDAVPKWARNAPGINADDASDINYIGLTAQGRLYGWNWVQKDNGETQRIPGTMSKESPFSPLETPEGIDSPLSMHSEQETVLVGVEQRLPWAERSKGIRRITEVNLETRESRSLIPEARFQTASYCGPDRIVTLAREKGELWKRDSKGHWASNAHVELHCYQKPKWKGPYLDNQVLIYFDSDNEHAPDCLIVQNEQLVSCKLLSRPVLNADGEQTQDSEDRSPLRRIKSIFEHQGRLYLQPKTRKSTEPKLYELILNAGFDTAASPEHAEKEAFKSHKEQQLEKWQQALAENIIIQEGEGRLVELNWWDVYYWIQLIEKGERPERLSESLHVDDREAQLLCRMKGIRFETYAQYFHPLTLEGWIKWLKPSAKTAHYQLLARGPQAKLFISGDPLKRTHSLGRFLLRVPEECSISGPRTEDRKFPPAPITTELWDVSLLQQAIDPQTISHREGLLDPQ